MGWCGSLDLVQQFARCKPPFILFYFLFYFILFISCFPFPLALGLYFYPFIHRILEILGLTWLSLAALRVMVEAYGSHCCQSAVCLTDTLTSSPSTGALGLTAGLVLVTGLGFCCPPLSQRLDRDLCEEWKH